MGYTVENGAKEVEQEFSQKIVEAEVSVHQGSVRNWVFMDFRKDLE